jgi:hypothetical protein
VPLNLQDCETLPPSSLPPWPCPGGWSRGELGYGNEIRLTQGSGWTMGLARQQLGSGFWSSFELATTCCPAMAYPSGPIGKAWPLVGARLGLVLADGPAWPCLPALSELRIVRCAMMTLRPLCFQRSCPMHLTARHAEGVPSHWMWFKVRSAGLLVPRDSHPGPSRPSGRSMMYRRLVVGLRLRWAGHELCGPSIGLARPRAP